MPLGLASDVVLESPQVPPPIVGGSRIEFVQSLSAARISSFNGQSVFVLTWEDPQDIPGVSHFNIYAYNIYDEQKEPQLVGAPRKSPGIIAITTASARSITFRVQTALANGFMSDLGRSPTCTADTIEAATTFRQTRLIVPVRDPTTVAGAPTETTYDYINTVELPHGGDSAIGVWFRVPDDVVEASGDDILLVLNFRPASAPGTTDNKVKLKTIFKVNNTAYSESDGDIITVANSTDWDAYTGTLNKLAGLLYSAGDLVQVSIKRDTSVGNNMARDFCIATIGFTYNSVA